MVVGNVARSQNSLLYHSTRPPDECLVVFLVVDFGITLIKAWSEVLRGAVLRVANSEGCFTKA